MLFTSGHVGFRARREIVQEHSYPDHSTTRCHGDWLVSPVCPTSSIPSLSSPQLTTGTRGVEYTQPQPSITVMAYNEILAK